MSQNLAELDDRLKLNFSNKSLLKQAFTHSSYVNEQRMAQHQSNERLEYLGDAVLELTISEYLYHLYPDYSEGELTKLRASLVCEPSLMILAEKLEFGHYVLLGKGEEQTGGRTRPALLADLFEAFIGALFLDQGIEAVRTFLQNHVIPTLTKSSRQPVVDYKTRLQEHIQHENTGTIQYKIVSELGPAHDRIFISEVFMDSTLLGSGSGRSKKEAEQNAASKALEKLNVPIV